MHAFYSLNSFAFEMELKQKLFLAIAAGATGSETTSPRDTEALPFLFSGEKDMKF